MLIFKRLIEQNIKNSLFKGKAILIFGPRQAGKTTLAKKLLGEYGAEDAYFNCELTEVRAALRVGAPEKLKNLIGEKKIIVLDEAQTVENIGSILKTFIDTYPEVQIIATGSSSFDLANKINEPLTGRSFEFTLYPLSLAELKNNSLNVNQEQLYEYLSVGLYPGIIAEKDKKLKESILKNITTNYLYKDIFTFESIKSPQVFEDLIAMLAFQMGQLISVNELAKSLGVSRFTVEKYIKLLEQAYVIKKVRAFSKNKRNEIKKSFKLYFIDMGIRNAVVQNISHDMTTRADRGFLLENLFFMELLKNNINESFPPQVYFWRNTKGYEVDFVLEDKGIIHAYECKWNEQEQVVFSVFKKSYPNAEIDVVTPNKLISKN
ncbi:MAG: ATP-binding protein [Patescibacteria group bacterium]